MADHASSNSAAKFDDELCDPVNCAHGTDCDCDVIPNSAAEPESRAGAVGDREVAQARPTDRVERVARALAKRNRAEDWDYFIPQAEAVLEAADAHATPNSAAETLARLVLIASQGETHYDTTYAERYADNVLETLRKAGLTVIEVEDG